MQIAIADAGFLALNPADATNFLLSDAQTAMYRALQTALATHPVTITDGIAPQPNGPVMFHYKLAGAVYSPANSAPF
ncbi:hypothetical protein [Paraburkholderia tagetis]|uniref:Uncharacterized protein n=1 Tax=Paraburkholderia tagetis TaxID=2913261 RepID=A0A9X1UDX0_9BURK|nr:hypothetical protein [Paraburkholderia tagetis]MCG5073059.1 hypothetical protein [Paraburkholderia tagetis]